MKLLWSILVVLCLLIAASPLSPARPTDLRVAYKGATPVGAGAFADECATDGLRMPGVVCVAMPRGVDSMSFVVDDASGLMVGGTYLVYDASGELAGVGAYCGSGSASVPPEGFAVVRIELVNGPLHCVAEGAGAGAGTRGHVAFALR